MFSSANQPISPAITFIVDLPIDNDIVKVKLIGVTKLQGGSFFIKEMQANGVRFKNWTITLTSHASPEYINRLKNNNNTVGFDSIATSMYINNIDAISYFDGIAVESVIGSRVVFNIDSWEVFAKRFMDVGIEALANDIFANFDRVLAQHVTPAMLSDKPSAKSTPTNEVLFKKVHPVSMASASSAKLFKVAPSPLKEMLPRHANPVSIASVPSLEAANSPVNSVAISEMPYVYSCSCTCAIL